MKRFILIVLTIIAGVLLVACAPSTAGGDDVTPPPVEAEQLLFKPMVRIENGTDNDFDRVTVHLRDLSVSFDDVPAGATSAYIAVDEAYQSGRVEVTIDGVSTVHGQEFPDERDAEPPITAGYYTYVINETSDGVLFLEMTPDVDQAQSLLAPLLTALEAAGMSGEYERSVQRGTPFDALLGETISQRELVNVDGQRLDVYVFADEAFAAEMATAVQPGGGALRYVRADGETAEQFLDAGVGANAVWWQWDRFLIRYGRGAADLADRISAALGEPIHPVSPGGLQIRVANLSDVPFDSVIINYTGQEVDYGALPPRATSAYVEVDEAYRYAGIDIEAGGETYELQPIDYVGETPLAPGRYTYVLSVVDGLLNETMIADDEHFVDERLLGDAWYWIVAAGASDLLAPPAADQSADRAQWPHITFTADTSPNEGEPGLLLNGYSGCNGMFGLYFVNADQALVVSGVGGTQMLCDEQANAAERYFMASLSGIGRYALSDDGRFLMLFTERGDRLLFSREQPATEPPYGREEAAALGELLLRLWPQAGELMLSRAPEQFLPEAVIWDVSFFGETIQVYVYDDEAAALAGVATITSFNVWTWDRYVIVYGAEERLIVDVVERALDN